MVDRLMPDLTQNSIRGAGDSIRQLLRELKGWDIVYRFDDFENDKSDAELVSRYPAVKTGVDGSIDASLTGISGEATIDVGDGANDSGDNEYGGWPLSHLQYKGDLNAFVVARIKISDITDVKVEFGFTDTLSDDAGAVDTLASFSTNAEDCALWIIDIDDTGNPDTWQCVGAKDTTEATKNEASSIVAPVNGIYQTLGVFLETDDAYFMQWDVNGRKLGETLVVEDAIQGGDPLCGWLFVQNRASGGQDRLVTIDYMAIGQRRF